MKKAKGKSANFLFDKNLEKCTPLWMKDGDKPSKAAMTHAQWVSLWWARALAQLTCQAASEQETLSVATLLNHFLDC